MYYYNFIHNREEENTLSSFHFFLSFVLYYNIRVYIIKSNPIRQAIMDTWTQQMGFPLITITRNGNTITAAQKRFLISPRENDTESQRARSSFDYKWYIPLSYYTDKEPRKLHNVWMNLTDGTWTERVWNKRLEICLNDFIYFFSSDVRDT